MPVIHDLVCPDCGAIEFDVDTSGGKTPCPRCGAARKVTFQNWNTVKTDLWGQSRFIPGIDQHFDNVSDLRKYCKENNIEPCGDKVRGARNEEKLGKLFSYSGQATRGTNPNAEATLSDRGNK